MKDDELTNKLETGNLDISNFIQSDIIKPENKEKHDSKAIEDGGKFVCWVIENYLTPCSESCLDSNRPIQEFDKVDLRTYIDSQLSELGNHYSCKHDEKQIDMQKPIQMDTDDIDMQEHIPMDTDDTEIDYYKGLPYVVLRADLREAEDKEVWRSNITPSNSTWEEVDADTAPSNPIIGGDSTTSPSKIPDEFFTLSLCNKIKNEERFKDNKRIPYYKLFYHIIKELYGDKRLLNNIINSYPWESNNTNNGIRNMYVKEIITFLVTGLTGNNRGELKEEGVEWTLKTSPYSSRLDGRVFAKSSFTKIRSNLKKVKKPVNILRKQLGDEKHCGKIMTDDLGGFYSIATGISYNNYGSIKTELECDHLLPYRFGLAFNILHEPCLYNLLEKKINNAKHNFVPSIEVDDEGVKVNSGFILNGKGEATHHIPNPAALALDARALRGVWSPWRLSAKDLETMNDNIKNGLKIFIDGYNNTLKTEKIFKPKNIVKIFNTIKTIINDTESKPDLNATFDYRWNEYLKRLSCITYKIIENNIDASKNYLTDFDDFNHLTDSDEIEISKQIEISKRLMELRRGALKKELCFEVKDICVTRLRLIEDFYTINHKQLKLQIDKLLSEKKEIKEEQAFKDADDNINKSTSSFYNSIYEHELNEFLEKKSINMKNINDIPTNASKEKLSSFINKNLKIKFIEEKLSKGYRKGFIDIWEREKKEGFVLTDFDDRETLDKLQKSKEEEFKEDGDYLLLDGKYSELNQYIGVEKKGLWIARPKRITKFLEDPYDYESKLKDTKAAEKAKKDAFEAWIKAQIRVAKLLLSKNYAPPGFDWKIEEQVWRAQTAVDRAKKAVGDADERLTAANNVSNQASHGRRRYRDIKRSYLYVPVKKIIGFGRKKSSNVNTTSDSGDKIYYKIKYDVNRLNVWLEEHVYRSKDPFDLSSDAEELFDLSSSSRRRRAQERFGAIKKLQFKDNEIHIIEESELIRYPLLSEDFLYDTEFHTNIDCAKRDLKGQGNKKDEAKEKVKILNKYWLDTIAGSIFKKPEKSLTNPFKPVYTSSTGTIYNTADEFSKNSPHGMVDKCKKKIITWIKNAAGDQIEIINSIGKDRELFIEKEKHYDNRINNKKSIVKSCILRESNNTDIVFDPLYLKNNNNGHNCCWINSSLYAFLSNKYVVNLLLQKTIEDYNKQEREDKYNNLHELKRQLLVFKNNPDGGWNNDNYSKLYELISSKYNWRPDDLAEFGSFGDARVTFDLFLDCFEKRTGSADVPAGKLKLEDHSEYIDNSEQLCKFLQCKENYICISLVVTDDCVTVKEMGGQDIQNIGHYVAYSRINKDEWRKMDSGNTVEDKYFNDIIKECPENRNLYVHGLFILKETLVDSHSVILKEDTTADTEALPDSRTTKGQKRQLPAENLADNSPETANLVQELTEKFYNNSIMTVLKDKDFAEIVYRRVRDLHNDKHNDKAAAVQGMESKKQRQKGGKKHTRRRAMKRAMKSSKKTLGYKLINTRKQKFKILTNPKK